MSKKTTYSSKDNWITGKQVTTKGSDGSTTTTNYKVTGHGIFGPSYKATSTTRTDAQGNRRTKTYR